VKKDLIEKYLGEVRSKNNAAELKKMLVATIREWLKHGHDDIEDQFFDRCEAAGIEDDNLEFFFKTGFANALKNLRI
jgi:hypothetical protein